MPTRLESQRSDPQRPGLHRLESRRLRAFAHVHAEKAPLYRAVMRAFTAAKASFVLHLRPSEIAASLRAEGKLDTEEAEDTVGALLGQLVEWGNLEAHPDTADVTTVEDFYRPRFLYQLTPEGEAVELALEVFYRNLHRPGELKAAALDDIHHLLKELLQLAASETLDEGKAHRTLLALSARFEELTAQAQRFIGGLQRTIDLHELTREDFLAYKKRLIEYLERFIGDLVLAASEIAEVLRSFEDADAERLLTAAARRDLADALETRSVDHERARRLWRDRWCGLRAWFIGEGRASQAEILRSRARAAIPALLAAAAGLHDRRVTRSDRTSDLRTLARWFAELDSDHDAHRLWRAAFGLSPARHLSVDAESLARRDAAPVSPRTSWLEAPPLEISPRLRRTGSWKRRGQASKMIDRRKEKQHLAELDAEEAEQIARARERLALGRELRLSDFERLERAEFDLFLDLLGEALAARVEPGPVDATSSDGSLRIEMRPTGDGATAHIETSAGRFSGLDHWVRIRDLSFREVSVR